MPSRMEAAAAWLVHQSERHQKQGMVKTAENEFKKSESLFIQAYWMRKFGSGRL